jgi:type I site-specific restriction-modification system R (restriction) subunit
LLGAENFILADIQPNKNSSDKILTEGLLMPAASKISMTPSLEVAALSKLFAMSIPSPGAEAIKDEVAFFQAVKARINKFSGNAIKSDYEVETAIKQIVDAALSSDGVIDIFEAAGINSPSFLPSLVDNHIALIFFLLLILVSPLHRLVYSNQLLHFF